MKKDPIQKLQEKLQEASAATDVAEALLREAEKRLEDMRIRCVAMVPIEEMDRMMRAKDSVIARLEALCERQDRRINILEDRQTAMVGVQFNSQIAAQNAWQRPAPVQPIDPTEPAKQVLATKQALADAETLQDDILGEGLDFG